MEDLPVGETDIVEEVEPSKPGKLKRTAAALVMTAASAASGAAAMDAYGQSEIEVAGISAQVGLDINGNPGDNFGLDGQTVLGYDGLSISFNTHKVGPTIIIKPDLSNPERLRQELGASLTSDSAREILRLRLEEDIDKINHDKYKIAGKSAGAFLGGALAPFVVLGAGSLLLKDRRDQYNMYRYGAYGACGAVILATLPTAIGAAQFDPKKFAEPDQSGLVAEAQMVFDTPGELKKSDNRDILHAKSFILLSDSLREEAKQQGKYLPATLRIILMSDRHNVNSSELINTEISKSDLPTEVVNIGDDTDRGSRSENESAKLDFANINVKRKWSVIGNHDDPETAYEMDSVDGANAVGRGDIEKWDVGGLRVLAIGDPFYSPDPNSTPIIGPDGKEVSTRDIADITKKYQDKITELTKEAANEGRPFDVIVTHEPALIKDLDIPVSGKWVGHDHKAAFSTEKTWWLADPGSVGGAGLRRYQNGAASGTDEPTPKSYMTLYFDQNCQLIEESTFSSVATPEGSVRTSSTRLNPLYDPELPYNGRCAAQ